MRSEHQVKHYVIICCIQYHKIYHSAINVKSRVKLEPPTDVIVSDGYVFLYSPLPNYRKHQPDAKIRT